MRPADGNCGGNEFRSSPYLMRFAFSAETPEFLPLKFLCLSPFPLLQRAHRQFGARDPNMHMAVRFYHLFVGLTEPLKCIYRGLYSLNEHPSHQTYIRNLGLEVVDRSRFIRWLMLRLAWFARPPEIKQLVKNQIKKNQTHFLYQRPAPPLHFTSIGYSELGLLIDEITKAMILPFCDFVCTTLAPISLAFNSRLRQEMTVSSLEGES